MTILTDGIVRLHPTRTNKVRCALYMEILDLLVESVSGARSVRATRECLKGESIAKVGYKMFFRPQTHL